MAYLDSITAMIKIFRFDSKFFGFESEIGNLPTINMDLPNIDLIEV